MTKTNGIFKLVVWCCSISQSIHLKIVKYKCKSFKRSKSIFSSPRSLKIDCKKGEWRKTYGIFKLVVWCCAISQSIHLKIVKYKCKSFKRSKSIFSSPRGLKFDCKKRRVTKNIFWYYGMLGYEINCWFLVGLPDSCWTQCWGTK